MKIQSSQSLWVLAVAMAIHSDISAAIPLDRVNALFTQGRLSDAAKLLEQSKVGASAAERGTIDKMLEQLVAYARPTDEALPSMPTIPVPPPPSVPSPGMEVPSTLLDGKFQITQLSGFKEKWSFLGSRDTVYDKQTAFVATSANLVAEIVKQSGEGYTLTSIAGDANLWGVVMSKMRVPSTSRVRILGPAPMSRSMAAKIAEKFAEGLRITAVAGWKDQWIVIMKSNTGWGEQTYLTPGSVSTGNEVKEWIEARMAGGYAITAINGDFIREPGTKALVGTSFLVVATRGTELGPQTVEVLVPLPKKGAINTPLPVALIAGYRENQYVIIRGGSPVPGSRSCLGANSDFSRMAQGVWNFKPSN